MGPQLKKMHVMDEREGIVILMVLLLRGRRGVKGAGSKIRLNRRARKLVLDLLEEWHR